MTISRRSFIGGAAASPFVFNGLPAFAQDSWPSKVSHVICGYAPGSGADILVRFFTERLRTYTGQPAVVENKVGGGGLIAAEYVVRSKPDGYTLYINPGQGLAGNAYLYKNLNHDVLKDFAPVTTLLKLPFTLVVKADSPIKSVQELITAMKAKGDKATYGAPNNISLAAGELLKARTGMKAVYVTYKSVSEGLNDLNNGLIDFLWSDATFSLAQQKGGKVKILAVTSSKRSGLDSSIPTMQEGGVPDYHIEAWWGAWYPANTPKLIVEKTAKWLNEIILSEEGKKFLSETAPADPFPGTPESTYEYLKAEIPRWAEMFKLAKIEPQ